MSREVRNHKDNVFCLILRDKRNVLSLYNALNKTDYDDTNLIKIVTLKQSVCVSIINDAAFLIDTKLNLYEHQSTINPNMPLRDLYYVVDEYKELIDTKSLYKSTKVSIPEPKFVVFYNGVKEQPALQNYCLSDMFYTKSDNPELELKVSVININSGFNDDLLNACECLKGYMDFVNKVRKKMESGVSVEEAVNTAIDECIKEDIMADFFSSNRRKIMAASIWEFNQELNDQAKFEDGVATGYLRGVQDGKTEGIKEGIKEGRKEGIKEGRKETLLSLVDDGIISASEAAKRLGVTESEIIKA